MNQNLFIMLLNDTNGISLVTEVINPHKSNMLTEMVTGCFQIRESKEFSIKLLKTNNTIAAMINGSAGKLSANPISFSLSSTDSGTTKTVNMISLSIDNRLSITSAMATGKRYNQKIS